MHAASRLTLAATFLLGGTVADAKPAMGLPPAADMQAVLGKLRSLGAKPLETLTPEQARAGQSSADAAMAVAATGPKRAAVGPEISARDVTYPGVLSV